MQRKFGFEVELNLALGWSADKSAKQAKDQYSAPDDHVTKFPVAATGDGFDVHVDHGSKVQGIVPHSLSIVELVTNPPIDESATEQSDVEERVQQMLYFVESASAHTADLSGRAALTDIAGVQALAVQDGHLFVGGAEKGGQQLATGYVQSTYVVKTEKLPQLFGHFKDPAENFHPLFRLAAKKAEAYGQKAAKLIQDAELIDLGWEEKDQQDGFVSKWGVEAADREEAERVTEAGLAPLMGLVSLLVNYLRIGKGIDKDPQSNLLKHHLGTLFYKSRLSSVRKSFTGASKFYLDDGTARDRIAQWIIDAGARTADAMNPVINVLAGSPKVAEWVYDVLLGTEDTLFDAAKNAYSEEIAPYDVGKANEQTTGVAVESRRVPPSAGYTYQGDAPDLTQWKAPIEDQLHRPTGDWKAIAVRLWNFLRQINDVAAPEPADDADEQ